MVALPAMFGLIIQTSMNWADTAMLGELEQKISTHAQSALGLGLPFLWIVGGSLSSISVGTQVLTARRFGANEPKEAGKVLFNALVVAIVIGTLFSFIGGWIIAPLLFPFLSPDKETVNMGITFTKIRFLSVFPWMTSYTYKAFFDGIEKTYVYMTASILMTVVNFFLNLVLIFGLWGFPRLEIAGAAWGSTIGSYVALLIMAIWSLSPKYRREFNYYSLKNFDWKYVSKIIRLSAPAGGAVIIAMTGFELFQVIANRLDTSGRASVIGAATWCIIMVASFSFISSTAFGIATATLVSESIGAKKPELAEQYGFSTVKLGVYIFGLLGLSVIIFPKFFLEIFARDNWLILNTAQPTMRLVGAMMFLIPPALIFSQALFGAGNTKFVMVVEGILHIFCLVPLAYLLSTTFKLGLIGLFTAAFIYAFLLALIMGLKFKTGGWKKIVI